MYHELDANARSIQYHKSFGCNKITEKQQQ